MNSSLFVRHPNLVARYYTLSRMLSQALLQARELVLLRLRIQDWAASKCPQILRSDFSLFHVAAGYPG